MAMKGENLWKIEGQKREVDWNRSTVEKIDFKKLGIGMNDGGKEMKENQTQ